MNWPGLLFGLVCAGWLLLSVPATFLALMSPSLMGSQAGTGGLLLAINFFTLPVATVLAPIAAGVAYRKGHRKAAWALLAVPLAWLVIPFLVWGGVSPGASRA